MKKYSEYLLELNNQIFLTYKDEEYNNGSKEQIAGVCDKDHLIFGMMPHPERSFDKSIKIGVAVGVACRSLGGGGMPQP